MDQSELIVTSIKSVAKVSFERNGFKKTRHFVVKAISFDIGVSSPVVNLKKASISAVLFCDFIGENALKEVTALRGIPLEYSSFVSESGRKATIEVAIMVLSSQYEKNDFCIQLILRDQDDRVFTTHTDYFRVVSKKTLIEKHLRKSNNGETRKRKRLTKIDDDTDDEQREDTHGHDHDHEENGDTIEEDEEYVPPIPKKKSCSEEALEILKKMDEAQQNQSEMIRSLIEEKEKSDKIQLNECSAFDASFRNMLKSFEMIPPQERTYKLLGTILNLELPSSDTFQEFLRSILTVSLSSTKEITEVRPAMTTEESHELCQDLFSFYS